MGSTSASRASTAVTRSETFRPPSYVNRPSRSSVTSSAGLVVARDVWNGFTSWPLDPEATVARIRTEWDEPAAELLPGDICWLQSTEEGRARAEFLLESEARVAGEDRSGCSSGPA
jgi:hypothetical protein